MDIKRWDLLNHLIGARGYKSYLEIGVMEQGQLSEDKNFDHIECAVKVGVDPCPIGNPTHLMDSDTFFIQNREQFDLVFIDGLHHENQVLRDVGNSLNCLAPGGVIVVHDCLPRSEQAQRVPQEAPSWELPWNGNVWKAWVRLRSIPYWMAVVDIDEGCGVIQKKLAEKTFSTDQDLTYTNLVDNLHEWLNLISWEEFLTL